MLSLVLQGLDILNNRGLSRAYIESFAQQMGAYRSRSGPFAAAVSTAANFNVRQWFLDLPFVEVDGKLGQMAIVLVGLILLDAVPHSASPERIFSTLGQMQSPLRNRLNVETLEKMATIKLSIKPQAEPMAERKAKKAKTEVDAAATAKASADDSANDSTDVVVVEPESSASGVDNADAIDADELDELLGDGAADLEAEMVTAEKAAEQERKEAAAQEKELAELQAAGFNTNQPVKRKAKDSPFMRLPRMTSVKQMKEWLEHKSWPDLSASSRVLRADYKPPVAMVEHDGFGDSQEGETQMSVQEIDAMAAKYMRYEPLQHYDTLTVTGSDTSSSNSQHSSSSQSSSNTAW